MQDIILSICIPTYNRAEILDKTLSQIVSEDIFLNTNKIQLLISDNCSTDNTSEICENYKKKYPNKIKYLRQSTNLEDKNFIQVLKSAEGKFAKLSNDTLSYNNGALETIVDYLEKTEKSVMFFTNWRKKGVKEFIEFDNFDKFINFVTYQCTWIGGLCVKTDEFLKLKSPEKYSSLYLAQVYIIAQLSKNNGISVVNTHLMEVADVSKRGGYNVCEVFGKNFITILLDLMNEGLISKKSYDKVLKATLLRQISFYHFDFHRQFEFDKCGYFKYLFEYYKFKPYYYVNYLYCLIKKFFHLFIRYEKTKTHKTYIILGIIRLKTKRKGKSDV